VVKGSLGLTPMDEVAPMVGLAAARQAPTVARAATAATPTVPSCVSTGENPVLRVRTASGGPAAVRRSAVTLAAREGAGNGPEWDGGFPLGGNAGD
jgi:hypothetical protein